MKHVARGVCLVGFLAFALPVSAQQTNADAKTDAGSSDDPCALTKQRKEDAKVARQKAIASKKRAAAAAGEAQRAHQAFDKKVREVALTRNLDQQKLRSALALDQDQIVRNLATTEATSLLALRQEVSAAEDEQKKAQAQATQDEAPAKAKTEESLADQLAALHFGLGLGVVLLNQGNRDILDTTLEGPTNTVRVTDTETTKNGLWLELHYALEGLSLSDRIAPGPFVAVQLATSNGNALSGFAAGLGLVLKRNPFCDKQNKESFNVWFGAANVKIQQLGNGITEDQPLPAGAQQVRYKTRTVWRPALLFSFTAF